MGRIWWLFLNAFVVGVVYAAPRELSTDELITEPRPGEEYVNIQTSAQDKVDLLDQSFTTSHRVPELSKTNRSQDFQTSHKIPSHLEREGRSVSDEESYEVAESDPRAIFSTVEGTTNETPLVVTRTSIKMSKSKKVQKSVVKVAHDDIVDIKADEGLIDKRPNVDEEEREIMKKKFSKSEESASEEFIPPTRFNVPFEDDVKIVNFENAHVLIPNPVLATTQEPPITTFNYKNVYEKKGRGFVTSDDAQDKFKYETVVSESINTAESKAITSKKDTKQDKKEKHKKEEEREDSSFYVLPVNKQSSKYKEDSFDFVDLEEKVVPAGSSPSQSSRINIKKGPNGQDYEYEYVYYYYDDDYEGANGGGAPKEGKVVISTTEKVYNGHDGPAKVDQEQNSVQGTSTSGNKYLPTEATAQKGRKKAQSEVVEETEEEVSGQSSSKNFRGGAGGNSRFAPTTTSKQPEPSNNEVLPSSGRSQFSGRSRGRGSNSAAVPTAEEIPPIGEERLPANTRFPPRSRANNAPVTPPPQETTARPRGREGTSQSRIRTPNLGLLDSSSFRTHPSDASVEEDAIHDAELQRKAAARGQSTETSHRRGTRPTTAADVPESIPAVTRRPAIRKPVEDRRLRIPVEEEVVEDRPPKVSSEENERLPKVTSEEIERRPKIPFEEQEQEERRPKVPLEEDQEVRRPQASSEEGLQEQRSKETVGETPLSEERRPQTTRESDAEEGVFDNVQGAPEQASVDQSRSAEVRPVDSTTEDQSAVGLTGAMMEKVALDLYAILQQAHNENIQTNFIDGNSTELTTDLGEGQTELSTYNDASTAEPSSTTTTTTTTSTTTTTTTTTTPPPLPAPGRGRYRGRAPTGGKARSKVSTTTTTEAPEEVSSPRTRGRFQPHHATRGSGLSFARKPSKSASREPAPEEVPASEETPRAAPERTFGDKPRNRYRASGKVTTSAPTTAAAPSAPASNGFAATRGGSADRFHSRRRGGSRTGLPTTQHAANEAPIEHEAPETHQEIAGGAEEAAPSVSPLRPTRPRIGGSVRPLRPGPRAPLLIPQRGHAAAATTSTQLPVEHEEIEKEVIETEAHAQQANEEVQEAPTTPVGDALTRLKSRPRLRIGANANLQRPQTPPPPPANRRKLVSSLLPKRKPTEEKPVEKVEEVEERIPEEIPVEEDLAPAAVEPSSTTAEPEAKGLSGLLAGRRRNLNRRPGTIYSRAQTAEA